MAISYGPPLIALCIVVSLALGQTVLFARYEGFLWTHGVHSESRFFLQVSDRATEMVGRGCSPAAVPIAVG